VEINSREHVHKLPLQRKQYGITTPWFTGEAQVVTYAIEELLGTKVRALYQRKKGRDLYDLARAMEYLEIDLDQVIACFQYYMRYPTENKVTRLAFEKNMLAKSKELSFRGDIGALLVKSGDMNFERDFTTVMEKIISKLP
jgi:predicted nucleotidyltransferase component of viral defense system